MPGVRVASGRSVVIRHKTLFRVLLKVIGVCCVLAGLHGVIEGAFNFAAYALDPGVFGGRGVPTWVWVRPLTEFIPIILGLYLFFGGRWIANLAIPSNRPYCVDCGYDLSKSNSPG